MEIVVCLLVMAVCGLLTLPGGLVDHITRKLPPQNDIRTAAAILI